ncbi:MAG: MoaD/ThiS family protein [Spirochaetia bacterium]|nr:MoaD/ThiS family protein [Spirochaetia bacterium]
MKISVNTFGQLTDFFEPKLSLEINENAPIGEVFEKLVEINPQSKTLLENCRIAVDDNIIHEKEFNLKNNQEVFIMPPFSGG